MTQIQRSRAYGLQFVVALWVSIAAVKASICQEPGMRVPSFPIPSESGLNSLLIPSFSNGSPESLYKTSTPIAPAEVAGPSTVSQERARQVDAAASVSSGHDGAVDDIPGAAGEVLLGEAYFGLRQHQRRFDMLLQQDSQILKSYGTGLSLAQYQLTTASFMPSQYERTMWSLLLENGYGSDSARATGNIGPSSFSDSPVPESDVTAFSFANGNILTDHVAAGVQHQISPVRAFEMQGGAYYHHFFAIDTSDQQYSLSASVDQHWSRTQVFGLQAEAVQEHYPNLDCTTGSLSVKSITQISESIRLDGRIGPIWGSNNCASTFEYNVSLTSTTPRGTSFYVGSARSPPSGFVVDAAWEESTYGGFSIGNVRRLNFRTDAGYSRYIVANPSPQNPNEYGYFVSTEAHHRLSHLAEISVEARFFYRNGTTLPNLERGIFLLTYHWSKEQRPVHSEVSGGRNGNE
jgi:hypothetical protein